MSKPHEKTVVVAALEIVAAYVATHPRAVEDAQRYGWKQAARVSGNIAHEFGRFALYAENKYRRMCA